MEMTKEQQSWILMISSNYTSDERTALKVGWKRSNVWGQNRFLFLFLIGKILWWQFILEKATKRFVVKTADYEYMNSLLKFRKKKSVLKSLFILYNMTLHGKMLHFFIYFHVMYSLSFKMLSFWNVDPLFIWYIPVFALFNIP